MNKKEIKKQHFIPDGSWVRLKTISNRPFTDENIYRFVTRNIDDDLFMDDGLISGQIPSPHCWYKNYEMCDSPLKGQ